MIEIRAITINPGSHIKLGEHDFIVERPLHNGELVRAENGESVEVENRGRNKYWAIENRQGAERRMVCLDLVLDSTLSSVSITTS